MWRILAAVMMVAVVRVGAQAITVWYDKPVRADAGFHAVDTLGNVDRVAMHVRLAADGKECTEWGIVWNYTDAANYTKATLRLPHDRAHSDVYSTEAVVEVERCSGGLSEKMLSRKITDAVADGGGMNSLKLISDGGRCTLYVGAADQTEVAAVPFESYGGVTGYFCNGPAKVQRVDVRSHATAAPGYGEFATIDELAAHIKASPDPMESFWEYLDRSADAGKATLGGRYTVATVRNGDAYDIIYIKGAEISPLSWKPMQQKGTLRPTIFRGNYDLEWITTDMQPIREDADAQLSDDSAILTLRFPVLGTQVRMRRLIMEN
ncbi:MAG: hypothetical protein K2K05_10980 [Muribaculaceae bacterium]|nr:hypothetical protein [Muribaculaceae bacterium]